VDQGLQILAVGGLLAGAVAASLAAQRLRLPAMLLFLAIGMAAGSDGAGWIAFDDYEMARQIGLISLALILFDGGLAAGWTQIRSVLGTSLRLAVVGTFVVAIVTGVAAVLLLGLSPLQGLLLGSMLASTDSAAVFGLLRGSTLRRRLVKTMEAETAFNDPVVLYLVVGFVTWIQQPGYGAADMAVSAVRELAIGAVLGILIGKTAAATLGRTRLPMAGLYPVASLAAAAIAYGAATGMSGSGLLAVYLAGLVLGDAEIPGRQTMAVFHEAIAWLAQIGVFVTLGLLASPARLGGAVGVGIALALVVVLIARPLGTLATTRSRDFTMPERLVLSWSELLGATPIVFASLAVAAGVSGSIQLFDYVFVAVVVSTLLQGLTFEPVARAFGLTAPAPPLPRQWVEHGGARRMGVEVMEYPVTDTDAVVGRRVRDLGLPSGSTLAVVVRGDEAVPPAGSTRINAGDTLHLVVREQTAGPVAELIERLQAGDVRPVEGAREGNPTRSDWSWSNTLGSTASSVWSATVLRLIRPPARGQSARTQSR
jgi:cell volume regulation protein A